jgi:hypothetical protein
MTLSSRLAATLLLALLATSGRAHATVTVGAGSRIDFGDTRVDFGCSDLAVGGSASVGAAQLVGIDSVVVDAGATLAGGSGSLALSGDFAVAGGFDPGTGAVAIGDGCGNTASLIGGSQRFSRLAITTTTARQLTLTAGATTHVGPGPLTLTGSAGNLLKIRSSAAGQPAFIDLAGSQSIAYVDVADNTAIGATLAPGLPAASHSVNSGNVYNWFDFLTAIPTLTLPALLGLALLLGGVALRRA